MSLQFIKSGNNRSQLEKAKRQEEQLSYFTESKQQDTYLSETTIKNWAERNYQSNDHFLNFIKSIFLTETFTFFVKYLRLPLPTAKLVKNKIEPQLNRVFISDNSFFNYIPEKINPESELNINDFEQELFYRYLYRHNSILICDKKDNKAYRYFIDVKDVLSIDHNKKNITKISFNGSFEGKLVKIYIDEEKYQVYENETIIVESIHNLKYCPAFFISPRLDDNFIVRRSLFSYIREDLENYTFINVLLKMSYSNGVLPIVSTLDVEVESEEENGNPNNYQPNSDYIIGSQSPKEFSTNTKQVTGILQPGSVNKIPVFRDDSGKVDMEAVKYFINFHYLPVENIKKLEEYKDKIEQNIINTIIGDLGSSGETSKNMLQIEKSVISLESVLISVADDFNKIREHSDKAILDLQYGLNIIIPEIFYGTSFFLENESLLIERLEKAPNSIERKNILQTINKNKYKNNADLRKRTELLYKLLPFPSDKDYEMSSAKGIVSEAESILYLQFQKYISIFESKYGDIYMFAETISENINESIQVITNLLLTLINNKNES